MESESDADDPTEEYTITPDGCPRVVTYSANPDDEFIDIEISMKEAVDVANAVEEFHEEVKSGEFNTELPVRKVRDVTRGGIHFPDDAAIMLATTEQAKVIIHALARHEPDGVDLTGQTARAVIEALDATPMEFDSGTVKSIHVSYES